MRQLLAVVGFELRRLAAPRRLLALLLLPPLAALALAAPLIDTTAVPPPPDRLLLLDHDSSPSSRLLAQLLADSQRLSLEPMTGRRQAARLLARNRGDALLELPRGLERSLIEGAPLVLELTAAPGRSLPPALMLALDSSLARFEAGLGPAPRSLERVEQALLAQLRRERPSPLAAGRSPDALPAEALAVWQLLGLLCLALPLVAALQARDGSGDNPPGLLRRLAVGPLPTVGWLLARWAAGLAAATATMGVWLLLLLPLLERRPRPLWLALATLVMYAAFSWGLALLLGPGLRPGQLAALVLVLALLAAQPLAPELLGAGWSRLAAWSPSGAAQRALAASLAEPSQPLGIAQLLPLLAWALVASVAGLGRELRRLEP